jgi:hypothetical protein
MLEFGGSNPFRRPDCLDMHGDKRFAIVFICANPEGDVPRRRGQLICHGVKINCTPMTIALPQTKDEVFVVHHARRRDWRHIAREKERLRISISERLQHFMPAQEIDIDFAKPELVVQTQTGLQSFFR